MYVLGSRNPPVEPCMIEMGGTTDSKGPHALREPLDERHPTLKKTERQKEQREDRCKEKKGLIACREASISENGINM